MVVLIEYALLRFKENMVDFKQSDKPDPDGDSKIICERWLEAWSGTDYHAVVNMMSDDAVYRDPVRPMGLYGKTAISDYLELLFIRNPNWRFTLVDCWKIEENAVVMKRRVRNIIGDRVFEDNGVEFLEVNDNGLISSCEIYYDRVGWKSTEL